jgi:hypothetical protein
MSIAPLDSLQIVVNSDVVQTVGARDSSRVVFDGPVARQSTRRAPSMGRFCRADPSRGVRHSR